MPRAILGTLAIGWSALVVQCDTQQAKLLVLQDFAAGGPRTCRFCRAPVCVQC